MRTINSYLRSLRECAAQKLEYFLNARVGTRINAKAWELLIAMLVLESAFGIPGLIIAPLAYAYVKHELGEEGML